MRPALRHGQSSKKLQQEFDGKIQILLINTNDDEQSVRALLEKRKKLGAFVTSLPSVCFDTTLLEFFPVRTVPHVVWINPTGRIASISYSDAFKR